MFLFSFVSAEHQLPTDLVNDTTGLMEGMSIWAFNVTQGWFWAGLLLGFCVVLFVAASTYSTSRAFGFAGVTAIFGSMFLITLKLMAWDIGSMFILAGIIGVAIMVISKERRR